MDMTVPTAARPFRFAIMFQGDLWDFSWTFNNNLARIRLQNALAAKYPNLNVSHVFAFAAAGTPPGGCDPQFVAWCRAGVDLVFGDIRHQSCLARLAVQYPNIAFAVASTSLPRTPNYAQLDYRLYQPLYLSGYLAGLVSKSKKVCATVMVPAPVSYLDLAAFAYGVHRADPAVEVHVFSASGVPDSLLDVWIVNQSYALGCDVMWDQSFPLDATTQAAALGMLSIGMFSDARLTIGETVITSVIVDMTVAYLRAAEAVLNGTFPVEAQKADWWMGWNWGGLRLADFSFLVPKAVQLQVLAQIPTLHGVFCGRICLHGRCLCNASACCLSDAQLLSLGGYPDFVLDHGIVRLPGRACAPGQLATWSLNTSTLNCSDCPAGTSAYNADQTSECRPCPAGSFAAAAATGCTACPVGMYNDQPRQAQCRLCPVGSIAANPGSAACSTCSSGLSNGGRTQCDAPSVLWLGGVAGGAAAGLIIIGGCLLCWVRRHGRRNNTDAPKDPSQGFCIIFTDIQGSTSLWAAIPDVMAAALDAHHTLIRRLIAKYHCYEVKTIGDSFMCATRSPSQAVAFALALQEDFVRHDWGTDRIDRVYAALMPPDAEPEAAGCWNGLRVRAGIHFGLGDIKLDPISKGYDYYGTVVNTAARIESVCHGGQTGVSAAVFEALG
eukprot:EG_transcript_5481